MTRVLLILLTLTMAACTYEGENPETYLQHPSKIFKDPHFAKYKEERDELERQYLYEEITYADYIERVNALDQQYNAEVEERNAKILTR